MNEIGVFIDNGDDQDGEIQQLRDLAMESSAVRSYRFRTPVCLRSRGFNRPQGYFDLLAIYGFLRICLRSDAARIVLLRLPRSLLEWMAATSVLRSHLIMPGRDDGWSELSPELRALAIRSNRAAMHVTSETKRHAIRKVRELLISVRQTKDTPLEPRGIISTKVLPNLSSESPRRPTPRIHSVPKLAVLFLLRGALPHQQLWTDWAHARDVRFFSHAKQREAADEFTASILIPETVETKWGCVSIVRAMLALLNHAVRTTDCTHFVFASETCIPVVRLGDLLASLGLDGRSRIGFDDMRALSMSNPAKARRGLYLEGFDPDIFSLHSQWVLLNRADASALLEEDLTGYFEKVFAPDESYIGTILQGMEKSRKGVHRHRITWDHWESPMAAHPEYFDELGPETLARILSSGSFFARKFAPGIETDLLHRIWR